jgi:hypothetical protein
MKKNGAHKMLVAFCFAALTTLLPETTYASLRASYELTLQDGRSTYTIRKSEKVEANCPVSHELGPYLVEFIAVVDESGAYSLQVSVSRKPSSPNALVLPISKAFPGSLGGPLEFSARFGEVNASGAVMLRRFAHKD